MIVLQSFSNRQLKLKGRKMPLPRLTTVLTLAALVLYHQPLVAETSQESRKDKTFIAYGDVVGLSPFLGPGAAAGYYLNPESIAEVGYKNGRSCLEDSCQYETHLMELRLKYFVSNSLYLNFGGAVEQAVWNHGVAWGHEDEPNADFIARATTAGPAFALGNMWQLSHFAIGCDWFGLYAPVALLRFRFDERNGYNSSSRDDDERDARRNARALRPIAVRFHIGASW